ncbi:MAG: hypothetical protein CL583_18315 [Alteromonadaceae bacterium]|nr:hypothetical protein [Alteromonadaceae bacterium]|tara:strand:- start:3009 stop:3401 length:393 start_codon:yes stop_codon:yes gene_type:complete
MLAEPFSDELHAICRLPCADEHPWADAEKLNELATIVLSQPGHARRACRQASFFFASHFRLALSPRTLDFRAAGGALQPKAELRLKNRNDNFDSFADGLCQSSLPKAGPSISRAKARLMPEEVHCPVSVL